MSNGTVQATLFAAVGSGELLRPVDETTDSDGTEELTTTSRRAGLLFDAVTVPDVTGSRASGSVMAVLGDETAEASVTVALEPAVALTSVLASASDVYADGPSLSVTCQVRDKSFNVQTLRSSVSLRLARDGSTGAIVRASTSVGTHVGTVTIRYTVPSSWFPTAPGGSNLDLGTAVVARLEANLPGLSWQTVGPADGIRLIPKLSPAGFTNAAFATFPQRDLFPGDSFDVPVSVVLGHACRVFALDVNVGSGGVTIDRANDGIALFNSARWACTSSLEKSHTFISMNCVMLDDIFNLPNTMNPRDGPEELGKFRFQVGSGASPGEATVALKVRELSDINSKVFSISSVQHGNRFGWSSSEGKVTIVTDRVAGVLSYSQQAELVNYARLTEAPVVSKLTILEVLRSGKLNVARTGYSCSSSDSSIATVTGQCDQIVLGGTESKGGQVSVTATGNGITATINIIVWFPEDIVIEMDLKRLRRVPLSCPTVYQQGTLAVYANFRKSAGWAGVVEGVDVTRRVAKYEKLHSTTAGVANVALTSLSSGIVVGARVVGVSPGVFGVELRARGSVLASISSMSVTDTSTGLIRLDGRALAAGGMSVSLEPTGELSSRDSFEAHASVARRPVLTQEGERAVLIWHLVFDDGSALPLRPEAVTLGKGLVLTSRAPDSISIEGWDAVVPAGAMSDDGDLVHAEWRSGCSEGGVIAEGSASIKVELEQPDGIDLELSNQGALTWSEDPAAKCAGIATSVKIKIFLSKQIRASLTLCYYFGIVYFLDCYRGMKFICFQCSYHCKAGNWS